MNSSGKPTKLQPLITFYPASVSFAEAEAVKLDAGSERAGVDIRILRGPTLSVKGRIAGITDSATKYLVSAHEEGSLARVAQTEVLPGGEFIFPQLAPGTHELYLIEKTAQGQVYNGRAKVTLADRDVTGVTIVPFKPAQVRVRLVKEGEEDKPLIEGGVMLKPVEQDDGTRHMVVGSMVQNGVYLLDSVPPGRYQALFPGVSDCYLKSVQLGVRNLDPNSIEVPDGAVLDLLLVYSRSVAALSGDIEITQPPAQDSAQPQRPIEVLLIAEDRLPRWDGFRSVTPDQTFHFSTPHVAPGKYLIVATQDGDSALWNNDSAFKAFQSQGVEVELHEKDNATIHLKLIPKDDTDRVRRELGL